MVKELRLAGKASGFTNGEVGDSGLSRFARPVMPILKKGHLPLEVTTFDTAPISALRLVGRRAEVYRSR
jgi:hypothetical protein